MDEDIAALLGIDVSDISAVRAATDADTIMNLIATLVKHRKRCGLTQKDVAKSMETTQSAVSDFERLGGDPHLTTVLRYARAVGMNVSMRAHVEEDLTKPARGWKPIGQTEESARPAGQRRAS